MSLLLPPALPLPPHTCRMGGCTGAWEVIDPGVALIRLEGGTTADRALVHDLIKVPLVYHGYVEASFDIATGEMRREAHWRDVIAKAVRLVQSGAVMVNHNMRQEVHGFINGDHGDYSAWFRRDDPNSWKITQWQCECPWAQYSWGRTRKWRKYEGRVCSHVLALYWSAKRNQIIDGEPDAGAAPAPGPSDAAPGAEAAPEPQGGPEGVPAPDVGDQAQLFGPTDDEGAFTKMPTAPPPQPQPGQQQLFDPANPPAGTMGPPGSNTIPPAPIQMSMLPPYVPGSTPNGMAAPPNAFSVPSARPATPMNPGQYPGGTYSRVGKAQFENGMKVRLLKAEYGIAEGKSEAHGAGQYREVASGTLGEVMGQDETTGWVEVIFPLKNSGPMEPYHVRCFLSPGDVKVVAYPPGSPFIERT